uniref:WAP domain-containing protein n=1 Tax=Chrysemys picta bellii TaxID=8478 RepID=A0A8C3HXA4_CHRPI
LPQSALCLIAGASHWSSACCPALQGGVYNMHVFLAEKSGICPVVPFRCKMLNPPNRCQSDSQCAGAEKCCDTGCGLVNCTIKKINCN